MVKFDTSIENAPPARTPRKQKTKWANKKSMKVSLSSWNIVEDNAAKRAGIYSDRNHLSVIFEAHGSVWPMVLPYCIFNVLVTLAVWMLKDRLAFDITMSPTGHKFMAMLISFLLIGRLKIIYGRFMAARAHLSDLYRSSRELIQHMAMLTDHDKSEGARLWRQNVAYRTILLLRVTMAAIEFKSSNNKPWDVPEMSEGEKKDVESVLFHTESGENSERRENSVHRWAHGSRTLSDEAYRAPIILSYNLRREILKWRQGGLMEKPFRHVNEELEMLDFVTVFLNAFQGLKMLVTTPFPFPLVQMARTFLAFWVFTLPFALCGGAKHLAGVLMCIFFITYGFVGLEYVSMELDDPFGDDPTDFDDLGMAEMVFEDIYITLYKLDGDSAAHQLREKISGRMTNGSALDNYRQDYIGSINSL